MSRNMESYVFANPCGTDPSLHRLLRTAPLQAFEHKIFFLGTVPDQFQNFIAYRDNVSRLGLLGDGMDTFSSSSKVNDFLPTKEKYIAEPQTGKARKEGNGLKNRYLARGFSQAIQFFHTQVLFGNVFQFDFFQKIIDIGLYHPVAIQNLQESPGSGSVAGSGVL